ncbi:hypothetical protein Tco_1013953, partial [Tanacetum coccineum]
MNRDEKSGRAGGEVVASVVGAGVGVDCCGIGVNGGIVGGMVVAAAVEVSGITVTGTVKRGCLSTWFFMTNLDIHHGDDFIVICALHCWYILSMPEQNKRDLGHSTIPLVAKVHLHIYPSGPLGGEPDPQRERTPLLSKGQLGHGDQIDRDNLTIVSALAS